MERRVTNLNRLGNLNELKKWGNIKMLKRGVGLVRSGTGSSGGRCSSVDGRRSKVIRGCSSVGESCN